MANRANTSTPADNAEKIQPDTNFVQVQGADEQTPESVDEVVETPAERRARLLAELAALDAEHPDENAPEAYLDGETQKVRKFRVLHGAVSGFKADHNGQKKAHDFPLGSIVTEAELGEHAAYYFTQGALKEIED